LNHETCKACGLCARRCPMNALELKEKEDAPVEAGNGAESQTKDKRVVEYDPEMCIGCGVCVHKCPTQSLRLVRRETEEDIPANMSEIGLRFLSERGRDLSRLF
jgi:NAD-dependent dihydropyrimidine dehydrogenase PreA subunit